MLIIRYIFVLICLLVFNQASASGLRLPSLVSDGMVLQKGSRARIWGREVPGQKVSVEAGWSDTILVEVAGPDSIWEVFIPTPVYGGPYEITIRSDTTVTIEDVLIGEVWVCSGQSNMWMPMRGLPSEPVIGSADAILRSGNPDIRLFTVGWQVSEEPQDECMGEWLPAEPATVSTFSAVAYFFGRYLNDVMDVPVGLIHSSVGGTAAECWTDLQTLKDQFPEISLSSLGTPDMNYQSPTVLFNGFIHPLVKYTIRGVIWYQGESNTDRAIQYKELFPALIRNWRSYWDMGDFPFYYVQIAPYEYGKEINSARLREAQFETLKRVKNTGMAVALDIGMKDCIHPPYKQEVGERLALLALGNTYGFTGFESSGPLYREMVAEGNAIRLYFDHASMGFNAFGREVEGFEIAGKDRVFHPARVALEKDFVRVWSSRVPQPVAVRYGWSDFFQGTLYNTYGLPASSFRTHSWE